jgi:hypothetical protein
MGDEALMNLSHSYDSWRYFSGQTEGGVWQDALTASGLERSACVRIACPRPRRRVGVGCPTPRCGRYAIPGSPCGSRAGAGGRSREGRRGRPSGRRRGRLVPLAKGGERASHAAGQAKGGSAPACQRPTGGRGPLAPRRPPGRRAPPSSRGGRRASAAPGHGDAPAHGSTASRRSRALRRQPGGRRSGHGGGGPRGRRACGRPTTRVADRSHAWRHAATRSGRLPGGRPRTAAWASAGRVWRRALRRSWRLQRSTAGSRDYSNLNK